MLLQTSISPISPLRTVCIITSKSLQLRTFESWVVLKAANTKDKSPNLQNQFVESGEVEFKEREHDGIMKKGNNTKLSSILLNS